VSRRGREKNLEACGGESCKLNLQTDTQGYVNFTGINIAQLGFESLASLVATQSKVSTLAAKLTAKRTRTVLVSFTVSPKPLTPETIDPHCAPFSVTKTPIFKLYLYDWLESYFNQINYDYQNKPIPNQLKIQSVELSTQIAFVVDISGGATPNVLGNGSTFIVPINGLSFDYNPDYQHKIDLTLKLCDNSALPTKKKETENPCFPKDEPPGYIPLPHLPRELLAEQCRLYAKLEPLLSGVKPPKDIPLSQYYHLSCNKKGVYELKPNQMPDGTMKRGPDVLFF
jgi:hypothetical protein